MEGGGILERDTLAAEEVTDWLKGEGGDLKKNRQYCTTAQYNQGCLLWMPEPSGYRLLHSVISAGKTQGYVSYVLGKFSIKNAQSLNT